MRVCYEVIVSKGRVGRENELGLLEFFRSEMDMMLKFLCP